MTAQRFQSGRVVVELRTGPEEGSSVAVLEPADLDFRAGAESDDLRCLRAILELIAGRAVPPPEYMEKTT